MHGLQCSELSAFYERSQFGGSQVQRHVWDQWKCKQIMPAKFWLKITIICWVLSMLASLNRTKTSDLVIATWPLAELYSFFSVKSRRQGKYINSWWKSSLTGCTRIVFQTGLESCLSLSFWVKENKGSVCWRDLPRQISESRLSPPRASWLLIDRPQKSSWSLLPSGRDIYERGNYIAILWDMFWTQISFPKAMV